MLMQTSQVKFCCHTYSHKVQNALEETNQHFSGSSVSNILFTNLTSAKARETNFPSAHKHCLLAISSSSAGV